MAVQDMLILAKKKLSSGNTNVYIYHSVLLFISNQDLVIYTGRVVAGSMEPPPLVKLGAKSEELLFASPRTSNVVWLQANIPVCSFTSVDPCFCC